MTTISIADVSLTAILGTLLIFAWMQNRRSASLGCWGAAHLILAAAIALVGLAGARNNQSLLNVALATMVLAYALMWNAARLFERRDVRPVLVFAGPCGWLVASFTGVAGSIDAGIAVLSTILAAYSLAAAYEYWRGRAEPLMSRWPAIAILTVTGAGFLSWILFVVWKPISVSGSVASSDWFATVILVTLLGRVALAFIVLAMAKERLELRQRTEALTDPLTGLANRRAFFRQAARRMRPTAQAPRPIAVLLFDIDHFKQVNDRYGHAFGDEVLRVFAATLADNLKATDVIGRVGGEEFAALLPETNLDGAVTCAERVRRAFGTAARTIEGRPLSCTVSVGVTAAKSSDSGLHTLLGRADAALYRAKESGRDRVYATNGAPTATEAALAEHVRREGRIRTVRHFGVSAESAGYGMPANREIAH